MPDVRLGSVVVALSLATLAACGSSRREVVLPEAPDAASISIGEHWKRPPAPAKATEAYARARRFHGLGRTGDAFAALQEALRVDPSYLEAHRLLQDLLVRTTADWWLRRRYEERLSQRPQDADAHYLMGRLEPDPVRQLALFSRALELDPLHPYASFGRAMTLARRGEMQEAVNATRRASAASPWLALPWMWLGGENLKRGEAAVAARFYAAARDRALDDPRAWLGLAQSAEDLGQRESASRSALEALRLAPGDGPVASAAVEMLSAAAVPTQIIAALDVLSAAEKEGASTWLCAALSGRLLVALGRHSDAATAFERASASGAEPAEVARSLRLCRVLAGRYREAVDGALATLPRDAMGKDCLYAPRWARLRKAARGDLASARGLLRLAEAMASVGWLEESRAVLVSARAADPADALVAARAASELAFGAFVQDLGRVARDVRAAGRRGDSLSVNDVLSRVAAASLRRLGRDVTGGAVVRSYPFLGEFAVSAASGGSFETAFGAHGLLCLVGARSGGAAELVLGRIVVLRAGARDSVLGRAVAADECWLESEGLPDDAAGLRRGLAGLTLDRFVVLQLDAIRRSPRAPERDIPFEPRLAATAADLRSLDTPSDVASRIEARVVAEGRLPGAAVDAVRRHELVHVLDAQRMLPVATHPFTVLGLVISNGFDAEATERSLEARAQAASISAAREPRIALASMLSFLPAREGETPHAAAYRRAAQDAVDLIIADPRSFPSIDMRRNVLQQMDQLSDAEVRELGRRLERRF